MENRNYSVIFRIMHWAIAICFILILGTIFLRSTWLSRESVTDIIRQSLADSGQSLSEDTVKRMSGNIRRPMWQWHIYVGYVLTGLFALRLALPLFGQMKFSSPFKKGLTLKEKFQCWVYLVFYACVIVSLTTGLLMEFGPKSIKDPLEDIHVLSIYYLITFIILHLGGVFMAEFTSQKGLISRIVSGKNE